MMKTKYIIGLLFLLITIVAIGQNKKSTIYYINAYVSYDNNNKEIEQACVTIIGNNKLYQITTDSNGHFCLESLENGTYTVIVNKGAEAKKYFDFLIDNDNTEAYFETHNNYTIMLSCPPVISKGIDLYQYQQIYARTPNQQIDAMAAYLGIGVDYRYSNTLNVGNTNEMVIGKQ
ncbi:MAG: carboxypeptidase-like regulatory domain-containing protein [Bacteroidota bacterium]